MAIGRPSKVIFVSIFLRFFHKYMGLKKLKSSEGKEGIDLKKER